MTESKSHGKEAMLLLQEAVRAAGSGLLGQTTKPNQANAPYMDGWQR